MASFEPQLHRHRRPPPAVLAALATNTLALLGAGTPWAREHICTVQAAVSGSRASAGTPRPHYSACIYTWLYVHVVRVNRQDLAKQLDIEALPDWGRVRNARHGPPG